MFSVGVFLRYLKSVFCGAVRWYYVGAFLQMNFFVENYHNMEGVGEKWLYMILAEYSRYRGVMLGNGFLYPLFDALINCFNKMNLVEFFKFVARRLTKEKEKEQQNASIAIDVFMVVKWGVVICLWYNGINNLFCVLTTYYLIFMNLHTYFYYHVWDERAITNEQVSIERMRRRFISLILALAFSIVCYAYLYETYYQKHFINWPEIFSPWLSAIHFSLTNSIKGSGSLTPITNTALFLMTSQFVSSFVFLSMMLSRSIPQFSKK